jgi:F-type H+-transporting ATPase subunit delta
MADAYAAQKAKEIFKTALEKNELNRWQSDLRKLASLSRDRALVNLLENPQTGSDAKAEALAERLGETGAEVLKLLSELINKGKTAELDDISYEYQRLLDSHRGIESTETAEITTAIPLDDEYVLSIGKRLTEMTGKTVVVNTKVDPGLIGGIIIKIGDRVIDGSIRSKLDGMKKVVGRTVK